MKKLFYVLLFLLPLFSKAQELPQKINDAITNFAKDDQFKHAITGIYIIDAKDGKVIFEKNSEIGFVPASCQKIITSASAFELLGSDFTYKTTFRLMIRENRKALIVIPSGDPTLGSSRWSRTKMDSVYSHIMGILKIKNTDTIVGITSRGVDFFTDHPVPDGWVWQDIGNYYGAGAWVFNWNENKYDLMLSPGKGMYDPTSIVGFDPPEATIEIDNYILTGKEHSGDNGYIYSSPKSTYTYTRGTIPPDQGIFKISGAMANPWQVFEKGLKDRITHDGAVIFYQGKPDFSKATNRDSYIHISPSLDSINYWFLKKSINFYGEALVKSIADKNNLGETDSGISIIRNFWEQNGIDKSALKIIDGSGLSPSNRVTPKALVQVLQYAKKQKWFSSFFNALPEMNGIKMKDGYIGGVRSYAGYVKSKNGNEYIFSFIVNNFDGNPGTVREKMWRVLDLLK